MALRPIGATLFIQPDARERTERGLWKPTIAQDDACTGVVVAVGEGCWLKRERGQLVPVARNKAFGLLPVAHDQDEDADEPRVPVVRRFQPVKVGDRVAYAPERVQIIPFGYGADAPVHYLLDVRDVGAVIPA